MKKTALSPALAALLALSAGCLSVKTENEVKPIEVKPIHITMDVNLKVDKELDQEIEKEKKEPPKHLEEVMALYKDAKVGMDNRGYLVARGELTDDEKDLVEDMNAKRRVRISEIAEKNGASRADVEKKGAEKQIERLLPAGAWYQDDSGDWKQK